MHDVIVANGRWHGGGMKLAPDARPDDGAFDVVLIGDVSKLDFVTTSPKLYGGGHVAPPQGRGACGAPTVDVDAAEPLPIELDGEEAGTTPARFEIVPGALRLRVAGLVRGLRLARRWALLTVELSAELERVVPVAVVGTIPSRAASRSSIASSRFSILSSPASVLPARSFSSVARCMALRRRVRLRDPPIASSPADWIWEITVFFFGHDGRILRRLLLTSVVMA